MKAMTLFVLMGLVSISIGCGDAKFTGKKSKKGNSTDLQPVPCTAQCPSTPSDCEDDDDAAEQNDAGQNSANQNSASQNTSSQNEKDCDDASQNNVNQSKVNQSAG